MSDFIEVKNNSNQLVGYSYQVTEGSVTSTTYFDTNFEITGEAFSDSSTSVSSSYNKVVANDNSYVESGSYSKPGEESRAFEFNFDSNGNFTGGTETEGIITYTYNSSWEVTGTSTDTSALPTISSTTGIPTALLDPNTAANTKVSVKKFSDTDSETTYFDASGNILGTSFTWADGANGTTGTSYNDADWNYLGGSFTDSKNGFSNSNFSKTVKNGNTITGYVESGTDKQVDPSSGATLFERSYEYTFDDSWALVSGTETENGVVITYGADWVITGRTANIFTNGQLNSGFTEVSSTDLAALPSAIKAASGKTYQSSETHGTNTDKTYYDANGKVLGYSFSWSNSDGSSGTGYNDANWNWLGDSFSDPANGYTSSFSSVEVKDGSGNVTGYQEKGSSKQIDTSTNDVLYEREWTFNFNTNWELVSGTEKEGLTTNQLIDRFWVFVKTFSVSSFFICAFNFDNTFALFIISSLRLLNSSFLFFVFGICMPIAFRLALSFSTLFFNFASDIAQLSSIRLIPTCLLCLRRFCNISARVLNFGLSTHFKPGSFKSGGWKTPFAYFPSISF